MGVTISKSTLNPLSFVSTIIGFVSFAFTLATFFNVFWSSILTLYAAPSQITDFLSNLKQGLLEERRHLRRVKRRRKGDRKDRKNQPSRSRSRSRGASMGPGGGYGYPERGNGAGGVSGEDGGYGGGRRGRRRRSSGKGGGARHHHHPMHFDRDMQSMHSAGEDAAFKTLRVVLRDMIRQFRSLEYPFLKPEFQAMEQQGGWGSYSNPYSEKGNMNNNTVEEEEREWAGHVTNRFGGEYRTVGFRERWLWLRRRGDVIQLSEALSRQEVRRTAHEVGEVMMMVADIGRDLEDMRGSLGALEGRLNRVVGVRRVD